MSLWGVVEAIICPTIVNPSLDCLLVRSSCKSLILLFFHRSLARFRTPRENGKGLTYRTSTPNQEIPLENKERLAVRTLRIIDLTETLLGRGLV